MSAASTSSCVDRGNRVLPDQRLGRDLRAEVAHDRAHVAVGQLEPRAGEGVRERVLVRQRTAARSARRSGRSGARGRWSASSAARRLRRVLSGRGRYPPRRRPSAATGWRPPGSGSAPTRSRTGSGRSCCPSVVGVVGPGDLEAAGDRVARPRRCRRCSSSPGPAARSGRPRGRGRRSPPGPRRGSCRRCGRRRSGRPSPRRSSPSGGTSRGCRAPPPAGPGCRSGPPG